MPFVRIFLPISCAYGLLATAFITSLNHFPPCICLRHAALLAALVLSLAGLITIPAAAAAALLGALTAAAGLALAGALTLAFLP